MDIKEKDKELIGLCNRDPGLKTLADRYFTLIKDESIGNTPDVTTELDSLEEAVRERCDSLIKRFSKEDG